jgi:hypothetical protein
MVMGLESEAGLKGMPSQRIYEREVKLISRAASGVDSSLQ